MERMNLIIKKETKYERILFKHRARHFEYQVKDGDAAIVPSGAKHNVINTSETEDLKLYTIYSPAEHKDKTVHHEKSDISEEHFDGATSE